MEIKKTSKANLENKKFLFREIGLVIALLVSWMLFEQKTYDKEIATLADNSIALAEEEMVPITQTELPPVEVPKVPVMSEVINIVDDNVKLEDDFIFSTEDDKLYKANLDGKNWEFISDGFSPIVLGDNLFYIDAEGKMACTTK